MSTVILTSDQDIIPTSQIFKLPFDVWNNFGENPQDCEFGVARSRTSFKFDNRNEGRLYLPKIGKNLVGIESESNEKINVEIFVQDFCNGFNYVISKTKIILTEHEPKVYLDNFSIDTGYYSIKIVPEDAKISLLYYKPQDWL